MEDARRAAVETNAKLEELFLAAAAWSCLTGWHIKRMIVRISWTVAGSHHFFETYSYSERFKNKKWHVLFMIFVRRYAWRRDSCNPLSAKDENCDGMLSPQEFLAAMELQSVRSFLQSMDVSIRDIGPLFDILDDGNLACDGFAPCLFVFFSHFSPLFFQVCHHHGPNIHLSGRWWYDHGLGILQRPPAVERTSTCHWHGTLAAKNQGFGKRFLLYQDTGCIRMSCLSHPIPKARSFLDVFRTSCCIICSVAIGAVFCWGGPTAWEREAPEGRLVAAFLPAFHWPTKKLTTSKGTDAPRTNETDKKQQE